MYVIISILENWGIPSIEFCLRNLGILRLFISNFCAKKKNWEGVTFAENRTKIKEKWKKERKKKEKEKEKDSNAFFTTKKTKIER